ncbi:MAG: hypothetical protein ACXVPU_08175 [Bacteroidia bacterium]
MKKAQVLVLLGFMAMISISVKAQKITEGDKDLSFLKGETKFNIEYDYNNMMVGKITEEEYKKAHITKGNAKQPGRGDRWAEKWVNNRTAVYEPKFEELINNMLFKGKTNATAAKGNKDAKYTIRVKTIMTEPGFNSVLRKHPPSCKFEISWVETATGKLMAKGEITALGINMEGSDWDFDPTDSIKECYAKAGKEVGKTMAKKLK